MHFDPHKIPILWLIPLFLVIVTNPVIAQQNPYPFELPIYDFIRYDLNRLDYTRNIPQFTTLFSKFDSLIKTGTNQINIVHIGGSHIQADIYTHRIRQQMQMLYPGFIGSRGFFFPYPLAKTNSPSNLKISWSGHWKTCRNTQPDTICTLGLSGITAMLTDSDAQLRITALFDTLQLYDFNSVRVFCNVTDSISIPEIIPSDLVGEVIVNDSEGYVQYNLNKYVDTLNIRFHVCDSLDAPFQLYGISLENDDPGVTYNSIGVNGARLSSYLRCQLLVQHLRALNPNLVIISIGTNDGNTRQFDAALFHQEYLQLLSEIREAAPDAAVLLTVPNDSYLLKRYINRNTVKMRNIIYEIAESKGCGVWDFYTIMGGLNSATDWFKNGLMNKDHIHFNKPGYLLKGDLFFSAFLNSWEIHLNENSSEINKAGK